MAPTTILSHKGYSVKKSSLSVLELQKLKRDLTVTPEAHPDYPPPKSFPVYEDGLQWMRIPRHFGQITFGNPSTNKLKDYDLNSDTCKFEGTLRDNQIVPHDTALKGLREKGSGLLILSTGFGKTFSLLSILSHLKQRTCILLHKSQLLQQWHDEIKKVLPNLRVGIIQQSKKDFSDNCDIYLIMIQTLLNIAKVPPMFGFTVIDECHHLPSNTFSKILFKVNSKYIMGLTATPDRKDGLTNVLNWHIGDVLYMEKPDRRAQNTTLVEIYTYYNKRGIDPRKYAEMITSLCNDQDRNDFIFDALMSQLRKDKLNKRRVLILTERKGHATDLYTRISKYYGDKRTSGLLLGGMKKEHLEKEMQKMILVATYNLMSEGISIPQLNTILFASPKRDVVQALGRIFRKVHTEINPMIIDIVDSVLKGQSKARMKIYRNELNNNIRITNNDEDEDEDDDEDDDVNEDELISSTWSLNLND